MSEERPTIWTIGHSNHSLEGFLELLRAYDISALADVRSSPASRFSPHFGARPLREALTGAGIAYAHLAELGGRPQDASLYDPDGRLSYGRQVTTPTFRAGLERLTAGAAKYRLAVMCSEGDPAGCHRRIAITPELEALGVTVWHIRSDGRACDEPALIAEIATRPRAERERLETAMAERRSVRPIR